MISKFEFRKLLYDTCFKNKDNLLDFLSKMTDSLTPKRFVHHQLPVILFGLTKNEIKYRKIKKVEL